MRRIINRVLAFVTAIVIAAGAAGMPAFAYDYYRFSTEYVKVNRGESASFYALGTRFPFVFLVGNTSKDTYVGVTEPEANRYVFNVYCGADEEASSFTIYLYEGATDRHNEITVCVADNTWSSTTGTTPQNAKNFANTYSGFNQKIAADIRSAEQGGTVTINAGPYTSFYRTAIAAITERPDVTIVVNYQYNKKAAQVTIPANAHIETLMDENGCIGFAALGAYASN